MVHCGDTSTLCAVWLGSLQTASLAGRLTYWDGSMYSRAKVSSKHEQHLVFSASLARCDRHCLKRTCREAVGLLFWTGKPCSLAHVCSEHEQHQVFDACLVCSSGRVYPLKFPGEEGKGVRLRPRPRWPSREAKELKWGIFVYFRSILCNNLC